MRRWIAILALPALWSALPGAQAAPTCQNRNGDPVHCDAKDATPLGWKLPEAERAPHPLGRAADLRLVFEAV